jgi:hypothetical protein
MNGLTAYSSQWRISAFDWLVKCHFKTAKEMRDTGRKPANNTEAISLPQNSKGSEFSANRSFNY